MSHPNHLYISLMPESLVASHLTPEEFGSYIATGTKKRARGQAIFFKLNDAYAATQITGDVARRMAERNPRRSLYLSIYRVLEHTPLEAIESVHLTADDGRVLSLKPAPYQTNPGPRFHLYQEFCPVTPRVVSAFEPREFAAHITDPAAPVSLPALVFAELKLDRLGDDPEATDVDNLPYPNLEHLRDCLRELRLKHGKPTKTVIRYLQQDVLFRTLTGGIYLAGVGGKFVYFPMPTQHQLETEFFPWWRSALSSFGA
ncbi:hypothetical protein Verru16b_00900 [Lacunisphaera limnophila]|uniref:Uncharacterized protein n=1 Tax=Lacunisphaera limnophila TaxID=1838286 RepID=A0A1D8ASK1_9BACT|nr:hypothetical protein [Lacunisphaera limnophila]AOS43842.1 hypothetical protein Verru16b_00900 [Lacunisphaera limnophila]